ncbi:uncharacterized protein AMSG_00937 [Thecamonas trahens ATCC 50062]|uniref:C-CAP/cofactor C-like domain-containing protein n=1 Tax=Thecamonas trahens ATCC 50062 TaxID=461836 RepID=A0A0L0DIT7_THETB|nr:hypothetical protein AMSG_00937 [Thecamonas trahens ATCC 50062]KNC52110.1 hypothetical protein AMSG_00937 [Thecamonas trahens ATCC 50062]|eukprot:XP_013762114.1 hypothetical protein AMSG_00937 [Thecamonas trahens ATCC 50062]
MADTGQVRRIPRRANRPDPADYRFRGLTDTVAVKPPGSINGEQFIIDTCSGCELYVLDHTATVSIDECTDCRIVLGPCASSVFVRSCARVVVVVACQQFRLRDTTASTIALHAGTKPIIEDAKAISLAPYPLAYPGIDAHFAAAGLVPANSVWADIYDFTAVEAHKAGASSAAAAFSFVPWGAALGRLFSHLTGDELGELLVSLDPATGVVPCTLGREPDAASAHAFVGLSGPAAAPLAVAACLAKVWEAAQAVAGAPSLESLPFVLVKSAATPALDAALADTMFAPVASVASTVAARLANKPFIGLWFAALPERWPGEGSGPSDGPPPRSLAALLRSAVASWAAAGLEPSPDARFAAYVAPDSAAASEAAQAFFAEAADAWQGNAL